MIVGKLTLKAMSRKYGNVKLLDKVTYKKRAINDRRIIKHWASELFHHKLLGEKIREGYNKAALEPEYNLDKWFNEFVGGYVLNFKPNNQSIKNQILDHLQKLEDRNGFVIGKLLRACWVDVEVGIAEVPYRYIYSD